MNERTNEGTTILQKYTYRTYNECNTNKAIEILEMLHNKYSFVQWQITTATTMVPTIKSQKATTTTPTTSRGKTSALTITKNTKAKP